MYGAHSKFDNGTPSTEYRRSRKGYCLASGWQHAKKCCFETWCRWPTLATVPSNEFCSKSSTFGKTPKHYKQRGPLHHQYGSTSTHKPLHADYVTICGLRLELECLIKPYAIVWEPIIYAAVARLFDHQSYHVKERPDVICGGNVFSGVEWYSLMNPGLVSSSTTVGFVSTDVLGSASLTLTLDNVTGSVVAASWWGAASLSTTGPPSMWWMAIWQESAISMRLSGRWFYQAFSRLAAGQFCRMTMPDPTAPGWWLTFSDNKVSSGWIGQHIRLTWPQQSTPGTN